jgi:hypothetical protein
MIRRATQIAVPIICTAKFDSDSVTRENERAMNELNEKLGSGWRIFSTHTVSNDSVVYLVYVLDKIEIEKCKGKINC